MAGGLLALALFLSACGGPAEDFAVNIAPAEAMGTWVTDWLEGLESGEGFQYFIYSDPDSWDLYLWYPEKQAEIQALSPEDVRLEVRDSVLQVYVTPGGAAEPAGEEPWVIHIAAPFLGAWPTGAALYWGVALDGEHSNT